MICRKWSISATVKKAAPEAHMTGEAVERLAQTRHAIAQAAADCDREAADVTLVAVTKTITGDRVWPVIDAGQRVFGENRVQEAKTKWPSLRACMATRALGSLELHLIGPLQSNKVADAVAVFDVIETVDRVKIAEALAAEMAKQRKLVRLFIQVNTGAEPQKAGVIPEKADEFIDLCRQRLGLVIEGLMCIPPIDAQVSPHFALLAQIAKRHNLPHLSMGMSADFRLAIQLGATYVRIGTAIFGPR
jgi:pyridoxal phosphate enzyme (YggS family)